MKTLVIGEPDSPVDHKKVMRKVKRFLRWVLGAFFILSGITHLLLVGFEEQALSGSRWPLALVCLGGAFETMLGLMLFLPRMQVPAAWGMIAVLIAVSPAYIYMALTADPDLSVFERWGRLALQLFLLGWVLWYTRSSRKKRVSSRVARAPASIPEPEVERPARAVVAARNADLDAEVDPKIGAAEPGAGLEPDLPKLAANRARIRAVDKRRKKAATVKDVSAVERRG